MAASLATQAPPSRPISGSWSRPEWPLLLRAWVVNRLLVGLGVLLAGPISALAGQEQGPFSHGLLGWDADWYRDIAEQGYGDLPQGAYRFFPLLPVLARGLGGGHPEVALVVLSNVAALALLHLVHLLAAEVGLTATEARRAVWAAALLPAGFVYVMGYSEALFGCLVVGFLLGLLRRRWVLVLAMGVLSGLCRPTSITLLVPALVTAWVLLRARDRDALWALAGAAAPVAGIGVWLLYVGLTTGEPLLPFRVQESPGLRGGSFVNTAPEVWAALGRLPEVSGILVHALWAVVALAVLWGARRRLPLGHLGLVLATLVLAVTAARMGSLERYVGSAVPLLLAVGIVTERRAVRWLLTAASAGTLVVYTALSFGGTATP